MVNVLVDRRAENSAAVPSKEIGETVPPPKKLTRRGVRDYQSTLDEWTWRQRIISPAGLGLAPDFLAQDDVGASCRNWSLST
jgi:hypothetical protein